MDIGVVIDRRYANLIRKGSKFWNVSGVDLRFGLFRGLRVNVESLQSLVAGGIAVATPGDPQDPPAKEGAVFRLHDQPQQAWLAWIPRIPIPPEK